MSNKQTPLKLELEGSGSYELHVVTVYKIRQHETVHILLDWYRRLSDADSLRTPDSTFLGANGDVKADLSTAQRELVRGKELYVNLCRAIYGVTDLQTGSDSMPLPEDDPNMISDITLPWPGAPPSMSTPHRKTRTLPEDYILPPDLAHVYSAKQRKEAYVPELDPVNRRDRRLPPFPVPTKPLLINDEEMMHILNVRGTVLLNPLFQDTPGQMKIVRLAQLALDLFREYRAKTTTSWDKDWGGLVVSEEESGEHAVFRLMLPVIRKDIHTHLLNTISSFPPWLRKKYGFSISVLRDRIRIWEVMLSKDLAHERLCHKEHWGYEWKERYNNALNICKDECERRLAKMEFPILQGLRKASVRLETMVVSGRTEFMGVPLGVNMEHFEEFKREVFFGRLKRKADGSYLGF